jgi:hypothetical protein
MQRIRTYFLIQSASNQLLTPWNTVLIEKLIVAQLVEKYSIDQISNETFEREAGF